MVYTSFPDSPRGRSSERSSGVPSQAVHVSRMQVVPSHRAISETRSRRSYHRSKNTILTVILIAMLAMIGFTFFNYIATDEFLVKREISSLTADYYENYLYPAILTNNSLTLDQVSTPESASELVSPILEKYQEYGFSRLTLRQLVLFDNQKHISSMSYLADYCDLDRTQLKIYPEPPYGQQNYRIDYNFSCKF